MYLLLFFFFLSQSYNFLQLFLCCFLQKHLLRIYSLNPGSRSWFFFLFNGDIHGNRHSGYLLYLLGASDLDKTQNTVRSLKSLYNPEHKTMHIQLITNNCKWIFLCKFLWFSPSIYAARYVLFEDITPVSVEISQSLEFYLADQTAIQGLVMIKSEDLQPFASFLFFCFKHSPLKCFITN